MFGFGKKKQKAEEPIKEEMKEAKKKKRVDKLVMGAILGVAIGSVVGASFKAKKDQGNKVPLERSHNPPAPRSTLGKLAQKLFKKGKKGEKLAEEESLRKIPNEID